MEVAFGIRAHSGWAAVVGIARCDDGFALSERCRIELVEQPWAKQPYHAAQKLTPALARDTVARGIEAAHAIAAREMRALIRRQQERGHDVIACALLVGTAMPTWSVDEIIAVHFRMHKAEGVLFRDALASATDACGLRLVAIPEKQLESQATRAFATPLSRLAKKVATLGKAAGAPWGQDQKEAALAAMVALKKP